MLQPITRATPRGTTVNVLAIRCGGRLPWGFSQVAVGACRVISAYA